MIQINQKLTPSKLVLLLLRCGTIQVGTLILALAASVFRGFQPLQEFKFYAHQKRETDQRALILDTVFYQTISGYAFCVYMCVYLVNHRLNKIILTSLCIKKARFEMYL